MDAMMILPRFRGVMVHDFWSPYFRYIARHAICNAHIIRELKGISENYGQNWSDRMHDLIYVIRRVLAVGLYREAGVVRQGGSGRRAAEHMGDDPPPG
jgi:hypothetical protein